MSEKNLLCDVLAVAEGRHPPAGTALDYHREAVAFAARSAEHGESAEVSLARMIVRGSAVIDTIYRAAECAQQREPKR